MKKWSLDKAWVRQYVSPFFVVFFFKEWCEWLAVNDFSTLKNQPQKISIILVQLDLVAPQVVQARKRDFVNMQTSLDFKVGNAILLFFSIQILLFS